MISFQPTEEEQAFFQVARSLAVEKIRPAARECEKRRTVSVDLSDRVDELGLSALELPESWGGLELPLLSQAIIWQGLSYGDLGVIQGLPGAGEASSLFRLSSEHRVWHRYREMAKGGWPTVAWIDEAEQKEPLKEAIRVRRRGSGYIVDGVSSPVRLASKADWAVIAARDEEEETVLLALDERVWEIEEGDIRLGLLAAGIARLRFAEVYAGPEQLVACGSEADALLNRVRARNQVIEAAKEVGLMEAALDYTIEYTAGRKAFGQEIAKFQGVSFTIAEMAFACRGAKWLVWQAAFAVDRGDEQANGFAWRSLARAHRSLRYVTDQAVQMLGGHGYVQEYPAEKWMRDAQAQVMLYGRERDWLIRRGEQLLGKRKERVAP
ncbi:acyl-CoA dehydrogenase family protein [Geobacillus sp. Y412MC52]|uniref:acyl-CoA dehydrogenase family protein n=1 Tax=Geobacillus sp. (strain Y412MC52) TaxID=550542 RepID=UPI00018C139F|nr:acyl-CoA dehydrogenase family protein [Geobacillus sp. Y412MC52]ADU95192.1 acyl-CoA dehydrogenase domain-containing protein [Geobacillus sp. Y412MC52]